MEKARVENVLLVVGVVALAALSLYYFTGPSTDEKVAATTVTVENDSGQVYQPQYGTGHLYDFSNYSHRALNNRLLLFKENVQAKADGTGVRPYNVRTNSIGLRDEEYNRTPPSGVTRIMVIGDSFVSGIGVNESDRFTERLEDKLNSNRSGTYQVFNAGIPGWGLKDFYRFLEQIGVAYNPDLVVILFASQDVMSRSKADTLLMNSIDAVQQRYPNLTGREKREKTAEIRHERHTNYVEQQLANTSALRSSPFAHYLNRIHLFSQNHSFTAIYYYYSHLPSLVKNYLDSWGGEQENVTLGYRPEKFISSQYRLPDTHPNPAGHRVLAEGIYTTVIDALRTKEQSNT